MDEILFQVLADGVTRYLDAVDRLAASQQSLVAAEMRRMSAAWRALLGLHRPAGVRGRCRGCAHRPSSGGVRSRRDMCNVWRVASAYFVLRLPGEGSRFVRR